MFLFATKLNSTLNAFKLQSRPLPAWPRTLAIVVSPLQPVCTLAGVSGMWPCLGQLPALQLRFTKYISYV